MLEEHLACPKCGYDLHGIPEVRCPECGFRYDAAALRSMIASDECTRLVVARDVTVRATIAAGLLVPLICSSLGIFGWSLFFVVAVAFIVVFSTWVVLTNAYRGLSSVPNLLTLFVALAVGIGFILRSVPGLTMYAAILILALTWVSRLMDWPILPRNCDAGTDDLRRSVDRYSIVATLMLVAASTLFLVVLVR